MTPATGPGGLAYLAIKYHEDHRNRALVDRISAALAGSGMDTVCVARDIERWGSVRFEPGELMVATFAVIDRCDVVVVELSEKGVGLGIEAGYAHGRSKPVVVLHRPAADVSTTLRGIATSVLSYHDEASLVAAATRVRQVVHEAGPSPGAGSG